jgi:hypothetical protein
MDHADSWFSVVRADHPGRTDSVEEAPLERQTDQNLNMKRYVAAGDRAYVVGVQDGSQVPAVSLNPNGIGWHITGQMGASD